MPLVIVEAQLSDAGLRPLTLAKAVDTKPVFVTDRLERYSDLGTFSRVFEDDVQQVVTADTSNPASVAHELELAGVVPSGFYTMCDYNLPVVAELAAMFHFPAISPEAAHRCRDKHQTREVLKSNNVPSALSTVVTSRADAIRAVSEVGLPCVVKPRTDSASVGVALCYTLEDALEQLAQITNRPLDARGQLRPPGALFESYLVGYEVSVETFSWEGRTVVLGVTDKDIGPPPAFTEVGETLPSMLPAATTSACVGVALAALQALGHDFAAAHTEMRVVGGKPYVIEVNGRLAGGEIPALIELATGIDATTQTIRAHLGLPPDLRQTLHRAASCRSFTSELEGVVESIEGRDTVLSIPQVAGLELAIQQGSYLSSARSNHDIFGFLIVEAETAAEAHRVAAFASSQIRIKLSPKSHTVPSSKGIDPLRDRQ